MIAAGRTARRWLRSELELLRRIGVCLNRNQAEPTSPRLEKYSDDDRLELATIAHDATDPIVREMIDVFDRELGEVRKEIMMSAIDDQAQKIAQEVLESGVAALTEDHPPMDEAAAAEAPTGEPATDVAPADVVPTGAEEAGDSIAAVESALAAAEADLADAVGILQEASDDVDMVAAACDATGEPAPDGAEASTSDDTPAAETPVPETPVPETPAADPAAVDAAAAESATVDAESADPHAEVTPDMQESAPTEPEADAPIASQDQVEAISGSDACPADGSDVGGDAPVDGEVEVEVTPGEEQNVVAQEGETGDSSDATETNANIESEPVATDQTEAVPEAMEHAEVSAESEPDAAATPSPESVTPDSVAPEDGTPEMEMPDIDTVEAACAAPSAAEAPEVAESAGPAATDASATAVADSAPMKPAAAPAAAAPDSIASDPTPERANQAVLEIEAGIRKLTALLSNEVSDQWKQASDAMSEVMGAKQSIDESLAQAQAALMELSRVKEEAGIARSEADVARREARLFRQDAELAKQRCDFSAKAAELAADQVAAEAQAAAKMMQEVCPEPA